MAFSKAIQISDAGITPQYWRIVGVYIDVLSSAARIVLAGYVSADIRLQGGRHIDAREYVLGPEQFAALAASPAATGTTYAAIATPCYEFIRAARRPVTIDADTGEAVLATGQRLPADQIVMIGDVPTVPSEFADAIDA